ncbi:MAG: hypothetical protein IPN86_18805 [Saprospiraceae bacterium]|nr:hypothetical protein [Saprospiraceae bacterium]
MFPLIFYPTMAGSLLMDWMLSKGPRNGQKSKQSSVTVFTLRKHNDENLRVHFFL